MRAIASLRTKSVACSADQHQRHGGELRTEQPGRLAAHGRHAEHKYCSRHGNEQPAGNGAAGRVSRCDAHKAVRRVRSQRPQRQHEQRQCRFRRHHRRQSQYAIGMAGDAEEHERERRQRQPFAAYGHARIARFEDEQRDSGEENSTFGQRHDSRRLERADGDNVVGPDELADAEKCREILCQRGAAEHRRKRREAVPKPERRRLRHEAVQQPERGAGGGKAKTGIETHGRKPGLRTRGRHRVKQREDDFGKAGRRGQDGGTSDRPVENRYAVPDQNH
jgi:hypothetical protein